MKRTMLAAAAILALGFASPAFAADSCKDEIAAVEMKWKNFVHETLGTDGGAWQTVGYAINFAKKYCAEGRDNEAFQTVNLMHRWMGDKEHQIH
ncbi:MAG: hypothetical protein HZC25_01465 [Rhodospirillales bacterium]|nr:hypothetical protein [Rhodospirillales bacterium]